MRKRNIPIFVPHIGCAHRCSFCDQRAISGAQKPPSPSEVKQILSDAINHLGDEAGNAEIAFFGGSFTAIDPEYMRSLLEAARPFIGGAGFSGIRLSTRPDAITSEILTVLGRFGVTSIELGAQSMDDAVLSLNGRGHTSDDTKRASKLIRGAGFKLGLQMMTGLPGDTDEGALNTAREIISIKPDTVRIYPVVVIKGTELEQLYNSGDYVPQTLSGAVSLCARIMDLFDEAGIPVIKIGLHAGLDGFVAGPYHPAFRQICEEQIMLDRLNLPDGFKGDLTVFVNPKDISNMIGQAKRNVKLLSERGIKLVVKQSEEAERLRPLIVNIKS